MFVNTKRKIIRDIKKLKKNGASEDLIIVMEEFVRKATFFRERSKDKTILCSTPETRKQEYNRSKEYLCVVLNMVSIWHRNKVTKL